MILTRASLLVNEATLRKVLGSLMKPRLSVFTPEENGSSGTEYYETFFYQMVWNSTNCVTHIYFDISSLVFSFVIAVEYGVGFSA